MTDYTSAKAVFESYLDNYDRENDKVRLKIVHTYGVVEQSSEIAERMGLSDEDVFLARIIALLHDIGRFEQLKRYDSFLPDTMDHAAYGVKVLFREGMIRRFLTEDRWDAVIETAIAKHSDFALEGIDDEKTLLHARIIRDADKLDNCRVKLEDPLETFMGAEAAEIGAAKITAKIRRDALGEKSILSSDRVTLMDYWNYVHRLIHRISYTEPETADTMAELEYHLTEYVRHAKRTE